MMTTTKQASTLMTRTTRPVWAIPSRIMETRPHVQEEALAPPRDRRRRPNAKRRVSKLSERYCINDSDAINAELLLTTPARAKSSASRFSAAPSAAMPALATSSSAASRRQLQTVSVKKGDVVRCVVVRVEEGSPSQGRLLHQVRRERRRPRRRLRRSSWYAYLRARRPRAARSAST